MQYTPPNMTFSDSYVAQEKAAVERMLALGVRLGDPITLTDEERKVGHLGCAFHLLTADGETQDGGAASTLLEYLEDGTYGGTYGDYTLVECR